MKSISLILAVLLLITSAATCESFSFKPNTLQIPNTPAPTTIKLVGTDNYENSIAIRIPHPVTSSEAAFDTEHIYKVTIKGTGWTLFVEMKSLDVARPKDALNSSADVSVQYFQSQNMRLISDTVGRTPKYGTFRDQEFGFASGDSMFIRTFKLDMNHIVFVMSEFDKASSMTMFNSIVPGTSNSMFSA